MKKLFSIVLAVVMVLGIASSAMAFSWGPGTGTTAESFSSRYKIEVVKLANETGIIGTNKLVQAPGATAVNNAPVYFYIRLTISGADMNDPDAVQQCAMADVSFTALANVAGAGLQGNTNIPLGGLANGVYYYDINGLNFKLITDGFQNTPYAVAAIEARCLDTATAKVYAKVYSERPFGAGNEFQSNGYFVTVDTANNRVIFADASMAGTPETFVTFSRRSDGQVFQVDVNGSAPSANWVNSLYNFLGISASGISAGAIYMTNANLRAALGFTYKGEASITWAANSTPIILDPLTSATVVTIPKTGDNASVIGFAMIMAAVVAAAVAVKKVKA
ncbi:MAG: hypothetical protein VB049_01930 [Candidatus Pelethousia sp.]|nr:hypothetical protein [Candidatus Pelethousia sp.]